MGWISLAALTFIVWWTVIFATLPFSLRTQDDDGDVTLGTVASAPRGPHMRRVVLRTTVATLLIMGVFYLVVDVWGWGIDDIPSFVPDFD
jgi:predicted secreted protein